MIGRSNSARWLLILAALLPVWSMELQTARGDDGKSFAGKFANDKFALELSPAGAGYVGTITLNNNQYPAKANVTAEGLAGTFSASGNDFAFTATLVNGQMILVSGGKTFSLTRPAVNPLTEMGGAPAANPPGNPLNQVGAAPQPAQANPAAPVAAAQPAQAGPADAPIAGAPTFGAFSVLGATPTGQTLFMKLPAGQTMEVAITQTADELGKVLDGKPGISGAFANAQGKNKGGASLTGKLKGKDIKGVIFCGTGEKGGSATVVIDAADASKEDVATLFGFIPAPIKMTTHRFPDGSGSIDLPDGWTTPTQSASNGIVALGPAGQLVTFAMITGIYDPNCRGVRLGQQLYALQTQNYQRQLQSYQHQVEMKKQYPNILGPGDPPTPPVAPDPDPNINAIKKNQPMRYCKFCDGPEEVLKVWYPLLEDLGKRTGLPYTALDKTIAVFPAPPDPAHPNFKSGTVYIAVSDHDGDKVTHFRALNFFSTVNVMDGEVWQLTVSAMRAPDATFDKDLPVMSAIQGSIQEDANVVNKEISDAGELVRKIGEQNFETMEKNHAAWQDQQAQQFHDHQMQMAAQQKAMHDSTSDFIEYIGGVRDVYDSDTGKMLSVDLFHSNGIVDGLNSAANDPNRFIQIPLRYER